MADKDRHSHGKDGELEDTISLMRSSRYEQIGDHHSLLSGRTGEGQQDYEDADEDSHQIPMRPPFHGNASDRDNPTANKPYTLRVYYGRAVANTLGPLAVLVYYLFIVYEYLERPAENDISPKRAINAKAVFFLWVILSIFLLDWAKSAIAGFEAAALMRPSLAPTNAVHLMWHLNRDWGAFSGWCRALLYTYKYWRQRLSRKGRGANVEWDGPSGLWWYLALSSLLFYLAIPLSGLSINPTDSFTISSRPVPIVGPNQTTFDSRSNPEVADLARNTWRQGQPTTPLSPTIFYALDGSKNVSNTFFEDRIQQIYRGDLNNTAVAGRNISFFSGPRVGDRAHGFAWGLQAEVSCSPVNIYTGLELIRITSKDVWSIPGFNSKDFNTSEPELSYGAYGLSPGVYFNDSSFGVSFEYMVASNDDIEAGGLEAEYANASLLSIQGSYEIAMWQQLKAGYPMDEEVQTMLTNPLVESSGGYLGYGVRCVVSSDVGFARLNVAKQTFSSFDRSPSQPTHGQQSAAEAHEQIFTWPSLLSIQSLVLTALTQITPGWLGLPGCVPATGSIDSATNLGCSLFYSANVATGGVPYLVPATTGNGGRAQLLRQPIIGPARMCLAAYKIFGETAAAMTAVGPGNWTSSTLMGVEPVSDIGPNVVPWQLVLALLAAWTLVTAVPQFWLIADKRWSGSLEPFEMFRFGAEFQRQMHQVRSNEPWENQVLREVPGMVGDRLPDEQKGFIGLSHRKARTNRQYVNDPAQARI